MNIAKFCIKHKVTTLLAVIMIAIFGMVYTSQLQMALLPNIEYPAAYVYCYYNGAGPEDIEQLVTRPLESAIMSVPGVDSITSSSADSISTIQIMYVEDTDVDIAATKLREKFDALSLPDGCTSPVILNINVSELMPSAIVGLLGDDLSTLQQTAEDVVAPALERIDGVASVTISGGVERQIAVELDATRAAGYGLTTTYITQILQAENLLFPAGEVKNGSQTLTVSTDAQLSSVEEVANVNIPLPTGGTVRLGEVASVELETTDRDAIATMDGTAGVILQVSKRSGANEVQTADAVVEAMEQLAAKDDSIRYAVPYVASEYINVAVDAALEGILLGVVLAAIVVWLFLRRWGATMTIAISMPICILSVFVLMYVCDLTLNMMSLGGIAMGVGMIVDNSIIVLENIYRWASEGHDRMTSCVEGTKEVTLSLTASTLTTVAVFLPLGLTGGMAGQIFKDFCLTIAFLIFASLAIAVTLVPLLCYFLLDESKIHIAELQKVQQGGKRAQKAMAWYVKKLDYYIHHLGRGALISVALVAVFLIACLNTKMVLLPEMDEGMVTATISLPIGSKVEQAAAMADRVAAIAEEQVPELDNYYYTTSSGESVSLTLNLIDKSERERSATDVANAMREATQDIAGCEISFSAFDMGAMMGGSGVNVDITGEDYTTLKMIADDLVDQIEALPDAMEVSSSVAEQVPQVKVTMDRQACSQYGLTAASVGASVRAGLTGSTATTVTIDNKEIDVIVRGDGRAEQSLDALRSMAISTPTGGSVPLGSIAEVSVEMTPQTITRVNQSRQVTISSASVSGDTSLLAQGVQSILDSYTLPGGYTAEISGGYTEMMENFSDLGLALLVSIGLVYFVLASQFESFIMPIIIMMILPIAFSGALFALPLTGKDLSMISLVSLIMLAGTVVNSSIVLVDYIKQRRDRGESREEAILHACPLRIRPVLMTTLTTILALVPTALGMTGKMNEMMSDMGTTMIAGMLVSTIITLLFTPVYYCLIDDLTHRRERKKAKKLAAEQSAD